MNVKKFSLARGILKTIPVKDYYGDFGIDHRIFLPNALLNVCSKAEAALYQVNFLLIRILKNLIISSFTLRFFGRFAPSE
jgi:hypothetical protein